MSMASRESIYQALFALFAPYGPRPSGSGLFNYMSREIQEVQTIDRANQPVLLQYELDETFTKDPTPVSTGRLECWILVGQTTQKGTAGASVINPLIDAVQAAVSPARGFPRQTLGGLVNSVQMVAVRKDIGDNAKNEWRQAAASIQLEIMVGVAP